MPPFADRLSDAIRRCGNPVMVGLDPRWESLPEPLTDGVHGADAAIRAETVARFCREVIDVVAERVPVVKPQMAFFERLGPAGMVALGQVVAHARARGLLVVLDGKRNDIGSTAAAYAEGLLGESSPWGADGLTVSPYLGEDSLTPFVEVALASQAGVFVLVKTSNPGGGYFQDLVADGRPIYRHVAELVEQLAGKSRGRSGYGAVGAVVGATYPQQLAALRSVMPSAYLLVPGYGSQGATAKDVGGAFDGEGLGAVVNNSRGIIFAHARAEFAQRYGAGRWQAAVEAAVDEMIDQLRAETPAGKL